jgi:hypothetical protein
MAPAARLTPQASRHAVKGLKMAATWRFLLTVALIPVIGVAASCQDPHSHGRQPADDFNWTALIEGIDEMHAEMGSIKPSGDRDVDFVRLMLPHHQGAVRMAKAEILYGQDAQVRRLAQEIITDQVLEIQLMQLWLMEHEATSHDHNPTPVREEKEQWP